jgi:hypothetical protein
METPLPQRIARAYGLVSESLPDHRLAIRRLIGSDERFRELCEELADAKVALSIRSGIDGGADGRIEDEWREIVAQLTAEILIYINASRWQRPQR